jgi:transcriptional regulator with XRE-family HTH domain
MKVSTSFQSAKFGGIYEKALEAQLRKIGENLGELRKSRNEDIITVAKAVELAPGVLERIESGKQDFRLKALFALCNYYETDVESVLGEGELLRFQVV